MQNQQLRQQASNQPRLSAPEQMRRMVTSHFISQSIYVVAKLDMAEQFATGPRSADEIATAMQLHAPSVFRMLRALCDAGVFRFATDERFELTELGHCLRSHVPGSMRKAAILFNEEPYRACAGLIDTIRTGQTAFEQVYGKGHFEYLAENPDAANTFHEAMTDLTTVVGRAVVSAYNFNHIRTLIDVGAGEGHLLAVILNATPQLKAMLFEAEPAMPGAMRLMESQQLLHRCELRSGDFFDTVPSGGDAYLLKSVLHDWDDARSVQILKNVRKVIPEDGTLLIVERVLPVTNEPFFGRLNDLIMMVVSGGMERTALEYNSLLRDSGFGPATLYDTGTGFHVMEARPML